MNPESRLELTVAVHSFRSQSKKITLVHGDKQLLNGTYPDKFRKRIASLVRERDIDVVLGDYIDNFPESGVVGVATRSGLEIADADLVVRPYYLPKKFESH